MLVQTTIYGFVITDQMFVYRRGIEETVAIDVVAGLYYDTIIIAGYSSCIILSIILNFADSSLFVKTA